MIGLQVEACGYRLIVLDAPPTIRISDSLYGWSCEGSCHPDVAAGEGLFVINAINGDFRYALGELDGYVWTAHRI